MPRQIMIRQIRGDRGLFVSYHQNICLGVNLHQQKENLDSSRGSLIRHWKKIILY
jgi:hypothetical protein